MNRILDPDEVAAVLTWLCSPKSAAITGSVVHADGVSWGACDARDASSRAGCFAALPVAPASAPRAGELLIGGCRTHHMDRSPRFP